MVTLTESWNCGIGILTNISNTTDKRSVVDALTPEGTEDWDYIGEYTNADVPGLVLATTIKGDNTRALRSTGFKMLKRFKNPNTGNIVTLWAKLGLKI